MSQKLAKRERHSMMGIKEKYDFCHVGVWPLQRVHKLPNLLQLSDLLNF